MFPRSFLPAGILLLAAARLAVAQQDMTINAPSILQDLDRIEQQQKAIVDNARQSAVAQLRAAASSGSAAADLYERAIEATQFDGKKNKAGSFSDWKSNASDALRTKEMQAILLFHLRYLLLSIDRKTVGKPEPFAAPSLTYASDLAQADSLFLRQGQKVQDIKDSRDKPTQREKDDKAVLDRVFQAKADLLDKSIGDSVFTKWFHLDPYLAKGDDWEQSPGNISGILEKNVRPVLRAAKNPQLISTWEFETKVLADRVTSGRLQYAADDFNTIKLPQMQFSRANDYAAIGQPNRAANEIYIIIKTYPQHPDFKKWVARLRELLTPAASPSPSTNTSATPAPASTP